MSLLGGKYLQAEQVTPGLVQTFRARDHATGRPVFVHRISDLDSEEQASLLKLLLSCLYRSAVVKNLVLEVREEGDVCYVVTESVPQCFVLREWLQFEAGHPERLMPEIPETPTAKASLSSAASNELERDEHWTDTLQRSNPQRIEQISNEPNESREMADRSSNEVTLSALFMSDVQPSAPQAAPMKSIRPLPLELFESLSSGVPRFPAPSSNTGLKADGLQPNNRAPNQGRAETSEHSESGQRRAVELPVFLHVDEDPAPNRSEGLPPAEQRPMTSLPVDEFSRLFADAGRVSQSGSGLNTNVSLLDPAPEAAPVREPVRESVPPVASPVRSVNAAPATRPFNPRASIGTATKAGSWTGPADVMPPILPSAAQTVLESALAAQAASRRNRRILIGLFFVLIGLAIMLMLVVGKSP